MHEEIKRIFENFKVAGEAIPVAHLRYKGSKKTFVTWTIIRDVPGLEANDSLLYGITQIDIDVFSDGNYTAIMDEIKKLFNDNDWIWVEDSIEMYEEDTGLYHRTLTFEKERAF